MDTASAIETRSKQAGETDCHDVDDEGTEFVDSIPNTTMGAEEKIKFKCWLRNTFRRRVGIFVTGKTGSGKSTLINTIFGKPDCFPVGSSVAQPCTKEVDMRKLRLHGARFIVWDCPGLQDGTKNEKKYLSDLKKSCNQKADVMIYCIDISQPREADEFRVHSAAVGKITQVLGKDIWRHTIVALTFADTYAGRLNLRLKATNENPEVKFNERIGEWKEKFVTALQTIAQVNEEVAQKICLLPTALQCNPSLPGHEHWLADFFLNMVSTSNESAQTSLITLGRDRMINADDPHIDDRDKSKSIILKIKTVLIPAGLGGSAAALTGAGIGATIGAVAIGVVSFGVAAGAGLVIGGAIGGAAGVGVGVGVGALINKFRNEEQPEQPLQLASNNIADEDHCP